MTIKAALDLGNSAVKGAILTDDNKLVAEINEPSAITKMPDEKYLTYPNDDDFYLQILDSKLKHDNSIVAVLTKATELPNSINYDVSTSSYKTGNPMTAELLFGSIIKYGQISEDTDLKLAVSIPIVEARTLGLTDSYKQDLLGRHIVKVFTKNGANTITFNIVDARIANEGQAGFFGLLDTIDKPFEQAMQTVYASLDLDASPVGEFSDFIVVDIGEHTTDISVFRNKKFNPDFSFSIMRGFGNLLEDARKLAAREQLTIESREDLQKVLTSTNKWQAKRREKWLEYIKPSETDFINTIVATIMEAFGQRDFFDSIIFLGGGFSALTGMRVQDEQVVFDNRALFDRLDHELTRLHKDCGLVFGVPAPYARIINRLGLMQLSTTM